MINPVSKITSSKISILVIAFVFGGISTQASGVLNSGSGGYLVCVSPKTKVVTHPGASNCPKGSKKLVLGASGPAGANGLTGAAGLNGRDGTDGKDGKTLWNGTIDPVSTWGAPGDMFINSVTKTLFGPKNLDGTWPAGVSMVGPAGERGPIGLTGATGPQGPGGSGPAGPAGPAGSPGRSAPIATGGNCVGTKCTYTIGEIGPGGGLIFLVDYDNQYLEFDYLEVAPVLCEGTSQTWSSSLISIAGASGWAARSVGRGKANTTAILAAVTGGTIANAQAATFADGLVCGGKTDWFLGSLGEMKLVYDSLQGSGDFVENYYISSSERNMLSIWGQDFYGGTQNLISKTSPFFVRPVRAF